MKIQQLGSRSNILTMTGKVCLWNIRWNSFQKNPLKKYPKNYSVSGNVDEDFCSKSYPTHSDFASGIFSVGCSCQKPITMGFTVMLKGDSGTEARCVGSYMIMPVELIDIF